MIFLMNIDCFEVIFSFLNKNEKRILKITSKEFYLNRLLREVTCCQSNKRFKEVTFCPLKNTPRYHTNDRNIHTHIW